MNNITQDILVGETKLLNKLYKKGKILVILIDKKNPKDYKPKLLNKTIDLLKKELKLNNKNIEIFDINEFSPISLTGFKETPVYLYLEYNKTTNEIGYDYIGSGYFIKKS